MPTDGPDAFYGGRVAEAIAEACWLEEDDLAAHRSEWVDPLRHEYRGIEVCELPPNGQGAAALLALALYDGLEPGLHSQIEAMKLALADVHAYVADAPLPDELLDPAHLAGRRRLVDPGRALEPGPSVLPRGGTTYLCAVDGDGTAISLIQSVYGTFGSGIVAPGTGVVLQNRAAGFVETEGHPNRLAPRRRPFHTIIPGMLLEGGSAPRAVRRDGRADAAAGAHAGRAPPRRPRGRPAGGARRATLASRRRARRPARDRASGLADQLATLGHRVRRADVVHDFGVGQAILRVGDALVGGSDGRGDGYAAA